MDWDGMGPLKARKIIGILPDSYKTHWGWHGICIVWSYVSIWPVLRRRNNKRRKISLKSALTACKMHLLKALCIFTWVAAYKCNAKWADRIVQILIAYLLFFTPQAACEIYVCGSWLMVKQLCLRLKQEKFQNPSRLGPFHLNIKNSGIVSVSFYMCRYIF